MVGRLLGKALLDNQLVTVSLARPLLKHLLALPVAFSDLEQFDASLHKNLSWMLSCGEGEVEALCQSFTASEEDVGGVVSVDLMPGGSAIDVADENKVRCRNRKVYLYYPILDMKVHWIEDRESTSYRTSAVHELA